MNRVYRLYVGARNTANRTFSPRDIEVMEAVLNRYFMGWTCVSSTGCWNGKTEESRIITVTTDGIQQGQLVGKTPIQSCANQLMGHFKQDAVMLEEGGNVSILT
ncbi:MAG: hypothetical protein WC205_18395 [Opitutaceae bacterium]|jgi:hypothetical protein